jgi:hypothetical protein
LFFQQKPHLVELVELHTILLIQHFFEVFRHHISKMFLIWASWRYKEQLRQLLPLLLEKLYPLGKCGWNWGEWIFGAYLGFFL